MYRLAIIILSCFLYFAHTAHATAEDGTRPPDTIDWQPWHASAFEKAQIEDKLIFLHIGYPSCYWCQLMQDHSFADPEVVRKMNEWFVSIKLDRDQRPDIARIYNHAAKIMVQHSGGWPLNMILTQDGLPLDAKGFATAHMVDGQIGLSQILDLSRMSWQMDKGTAYQTANALRMRISDDLYAPAADNKDTAALADAAATQKINAYLQNAYDKEYSGFFRYPKSPNGHYLLYLLNTENRILAEETLAKMARSPIHDHLAGGFYSFTYDQKWLSPHFEKLLYTQAQMVLAFTQAYAQTPDTAKTQRHLFEKAARRTLDYIDHEMTAPNGGFYTGRSATVNKTEGLFEAWSDMQLRNGLRPEELDTLNSLVNFTETQTWAPSFANSGQIPYLKDKLTIEQVDAAYTLFNKLNTKRAQRQAPDIDKKIITSWNARTTQAFCQAGKIFDEDHYIEKAENSAAFLWENMRNTKNKLQHIAPRSPLTKLYFLEDYAFFAKALSCLYDSTQKDIYLERIQTLIKTADDILKDNAEDGYYDTLANEAMMITHIKTARDDIIPAANAVMADVFIDLWQYTSLKKWKTKAEKLLLRFVEDAQEHPQHHAHFMSVLERYQNLEMTESANE